MHVSSGRWLYGFLLTLTTTMLWGVLPILLKEVLQVMDPYTVTWYRFLSAGLVLFCWLAAKRRLPSIRALSSRNRGLLIVAIGGLACNYVLYVMALQRLTPGTMQLIIQVAPIMLMFGSMLVFRERFGIGQLIGLLVLIPGFGLFFNQRLLELLTQMTSYTTGILIAIASAFSWALYGLAQKQLLTIWSSVTVMMVIYLACSVLLWPLASPLEVLQLSTLQRWLLLGCCLNTLVAYGAFAEALAHWEASRVSATVATTPLFTFSLVALGSMLWPSVIEPELLNSLAYLGALMVVGGSALIALAPSLIQNLRNRRLRRLSITPPPAP
ncbi:DMT family transporter [Pseudomonas neustonica]|uniref:DMT family transporter n=1 Tax=Pseudomonas neustonica TaxID=2487346 RepID=A0ABX9XKM0_9PSED|nr:MULTISPECIES: DMT family transporter [Pseudomonas]MAB22915.1 EamA family transporter [Pseudomonadales bacterium]MBA6418903.1 DMT family transporter [Pseudomonas sp. 5Ae-yellow]ROZ82442.1 DMT family transporter [Pseudomonas sp. SSM44]ROZ84310.1 DMT family transporter [Pseudomonas neustonica]|tara:strand:- start:403 stop:1380 length:978 start_codon:yes stop_codon:yes gene_type:complete